MEKHYDSFRQRVNRVILRRRGSVKLDSNGLTTVEFQVKANAGYAYFDLLVGKPTGVDMAAANGVLQIFFDC